MLRAAAIACCCLIALPVHAETWRGPSCDTLGIHLRTCSHPTQGARYEALTVMPSSFWPAAYRELAHRPDLEWVAFVVVHDTTLTWPRGLVPVLYAPDRHVPVRSFIVGGPPRLEPMPLTRLDPGELWRQRWPCIKAVGSLLFVGYQRGGWDADNVTRVCLEARDAVVPLRGK